MSRKRATVVLISILLFSLLPFNRVEAKQDFLMNVKLRYFLGNQNSITIIAKGEYTDTKGKSFLKTGEKAVIKVVTKQRLVGKKKVTTKEMAIYKNGKEIASYQSPFTIKPIRQDSQLFVNNKSYWGSFKFEIEKGSYVRPTNTLPIEMYLRGVVPKEMLGSWPVETLKVQAVAARTYALKQMKGNDGIINDTTSFQVYGGTESYPNSDRAIRETAGMVLKYNGQLIEALYSSSNGGWTESNENVWGSKALSYFPVKSDPYDPYKSTAKYDAKRPLDPVSGWRVQFAKQQLNLKDKNLNDASKWWSQTKEADSSFIPYLKNYLKLNEYKGKDIKIAEVSEFSFDTKNVFTSKRVKTGSIVVKVLLNNKGKVSTSYFKRNNVPAEEMRNMIGGAGKMPSLLVRNQEINKNYIIIKGSGNGHGIGMSQYGAYKMTTLKKSYKEILQFYYPGTNLIREYTPVPIPPTPSINGIVSDRSTSVSGKTKAYYTVYIEAGKYKWSKPADSRGNFKIPISKQKAGTILKITTRDANKLYSPYKNITVVDKTPPSVPSVNKVTTKSVNITGKSEKGATVYIMKGKTRIGKAIVNTKGIYSAKITKQKKGTLLSVYATDKAANKSGSRSVKVY